MSYDDYKLATPPVFSSEEDIMLRCEICNDLISADEITEVTFRGIKVSCCGYCKENVLNGDI